MDITEFKKLLGNCYVSIIQVMGLEKRLSDLESAGPGGGTWGSITGTLSNQTDLNTALGNKVDKVTGKGLSTNDYTTAEQTKLSGIAAGAEVNVNADWAAISGDAQILNKPSIPTQYTDEMAQDAIGAMVDGSVVYDDATPYLRLDGDSDSPGINKVYGTNGAGTKGWKDDPAVGSGEAIKKTYTQAGHSFTVGEAVYRTAGAWARGKADVLSTAEAEGVVESVAGDDFVLVEGGVITGLSGGTDGSWGFLSKDTAGAITTAEPDPTTYVSKPILKWTGTTTAIVQIMRGLQFPSAAAGVIVIILS